MHAFTDHAENTYCDVLADCLACGLLRYSALLLLVSCLYTPNNALMLCYTHQHVSVWRNIVASASAAQQASVLELMVLLVVLGLVPRAAPCHKPCACSG
jgi:hypothetical protein